MKIINGKEISQSIRQDLKNRRRSGKQSLCRFKNKGVRTSRNKIVS